MRIIYVNTPIYDYLTATVIEGLTELGHEVICSEASNYGRAAPETELVQRAEDADLIVVGSNVGVQHHLLEGVANARRVFVDGTDGARIEAPAGIRFKAIFKRELCKEDREAGGDGVYPLPFAAERRYFTQPQSKDILASFVASMHSNPMRNSVHVRMRNRGNPLIVSGSTNERSYTPGQPRPLPIETPGYRSLLARSLISVNVPGWGYDCARYWEIPAAGAMLLTYLPDIVIPDDFQDGVDCATFRSLEEFESKLDFYTGRPEVAARIAACGVERLNRCHTTARRAAYFLEKALEAAGREGFCERFFGGGA